MSDYDRGLYNKFAVVRTDGSSEPGGKHHKCNYFVLDLTHDKFAAVAIAEYARACRHEFPLLAVDLMNMLGDLPFGVLPRESNKCPKCGELLTFIMYNTRDNPERPGFMKAYCVTCERPFFVTL